MGFSLTEISNKTVPITPTSDSRFKSDELVKVPFREGYYAAENTGAAFQRGGYESNEDGSNTLLYVNVPSGLGNGSRIRFPFYGRKLGIRWKRDNTACDFSVMIDGVAYSVKGQHSYFIDEGVNTIFDGESLVVIEDLLTDGVHYADIQVNPPSTGTNQISFYGILVERRAGYEPRPRVNGVNTTASVPTTSTTISFVNNADSYELFKTLRKIMYVNTGASALTVTVTLNSTTFWVKTIQPNDSAELDFGSNTAFSSSSLKHSTSAAGLNFTLVGGY